MNEVYEIFYKNKNGDVVFYGTLDSEMEAIERVQLLVTEFPDDECWYEIAYEEEL